ASPFAARRPLSSPATRLQGGRRKRRHARSAGAWRRGRIDAMVQGAVRTKALLLAQSPETLAAINAAVAQGVEKPFRHGKTFEVPIPAVVGSGQKREQGADRFTPDSCVSDPAANGAHGLVRSPERKSLTEAAGLSGCAGVKLHQQLAF